MDKKYEISWRDPQQTVLLVDYQPAIDWSDGLSANIEALDIIKQIPHEVILFHRLSHSIIAPLRFGIIHDIFYNKLPRPSKNLKMIVVVFKDAETVKSVGASMEVLDKIFFKRKYAYIVDNMEEAEQLIARAGF